MPRRGKDKFAEYNGKFKYVSANFQKDFAVKSDKVEVKSHVEIEQDEEVIVKTDVPIEGEIADYTAEDMKKARRKKILDNHPDRGGSEEALKKVLDEEG